MKKTLVSMLGLVALTAMVALGADIDGKYMSEAQGKGGPQTLMLKASGDKLTGTMEGGRGGVSFIMQRSKRSESVANQVGKRYLCTRCNTEMIVTKGGSGALACCGQPMQQKP